MKQTITRLFDSRTHAETVVRDLEKMGVSHNDISILSATTAQAESRTFSDQPVAHEHRTEAGPAAGFGATTGGLIGAGAGLLAGLGMIVIPGLGPVLAAGWIATTIGGAVVGGVAGGALGGILGALKEAGVSEEDANVYAEGVRRGGSLVSVRVDAHDAARVEELLSRERGVDAATRGAVYREEGWTRFDPDAPPYVRSDTTATSRDGIVREDRVPRDEPVVREERTNLIDRLDS
jgi:hypothetical protein